MSVKSETGSGPRPFEAGSGMSAKDEDQVRVWDPLVRYGHWFLALCFAVAYLSEGEPLWLHSWAGYGVGAYVMLRVLWGFAGPAPARFANFITPPRAVLGYLRGLLTGGAQRHLGHSPAGGAMVIALLFMLGVTALSGMALLAAEEGEGPLAPFFAGGQMQEIAFIAPARADDEYEDHEGAEFLEEIHELAANLTLALVLLHLAGVAASSIAHKENLPRAMLTGFKRRS